jgi:5'/3'-nucleotidase SurE
MNGCIVLCNDDGIEAAALHAVADILVEMGQEVVIVAPAENKSACGMSLTLRVPLRLDNHPRLEKEGLRVFALAGTPADCAIAVGDGLLEELGIRSFPRLLLSGINLGSNMSIDSLHSGTIAAAREAGLYGIPSLAVSLTSFDDEGMPRALLATKKLLEKILPLLPEAPRNWPRNLNKEVEFQPLDSFLAGESFLNINVPADWNGNFRNTRLGRRHYLGALSFTEGKVEIGASEIINGVHENGDVDATVAGFASISLLGSHPSQHPDHPPDSVFMKHLEVLDDMPNWFQD